MVDASRRLTVLYGSETGTAQDLAEEIWRQSKARNFTGPVMAMDEYDIGKLINESIVVFVCSTTGQGEEPCNMKTFWRFLLRKSLPVDSLSGVQVAVLGLGDSGYAKFNFVAKRFAKRLQQLGSISLIPAGLCDEQHDLGLSATYMPWLTSLWQVLGDKNSPTACLPIRNEHQYRWDVKIIDEDKENNARIRPAARDIFQFDNQADEIFETMVLNNERTTSKDHFQDVRLLKFDRSYAKWSPGDVFVTRPENSTDSVDKLFDLFASHNLPFYPETVVAVEEINDGPAENAGMSGETGGANTANSQDDEYRYAGCEDPKIMITTSRDPSVRLKMFVKELRLIFPNAQRMNRGNYEMKQLLHACRANDVTDFVVVHENRGVPDNLVICHLPYGPTAYFNLSSVVMRHDIPDIGPMSEQKPNLIFHNFKTKLGERAMSILKYLFPVPKEDSKRVITFANHDDFILFRHHTHKKVEGQLELTEAGPRFQLRLYQIKRGTLDEIKAADTEWVLRPYMNTAAKRRFISDDDGWVQDEDDDNA